MEKLTCLGCGAVFKHASSLSTHKNGNAKKGLKPCTKYIIMMGDKYKDKIETRTLTEEEYTNLTALMENAIKVWKSFKERDVSRPKQTLLAFPQREIPSHVSPEWLLQRFMNQRYDDFVATAFAAFYLDTYNGRDYCVIRIPNVGRDSDLEYFDGKYWRVIKIYNMLDSFISSLCMILDDLSPDSSRFERFQLWTPNDEDDLKNGMKREQDDDGVYHTYSYTSLISKVKNLLLGNTRDEITQIKKDHKKSTS